MWLRSLLTAGVLALAPPALAQESSGDDLREQFNALEDEFDDAYAEWRDAMRAWSTERRAAGEAGETFEERPPAPLDPEYFPRFDRLAEAGSTGAQMWCVAHYVGAEDLDDAGRRRELTRRVARILADPDADLAPLPRVLRGKRRILGEDGTRNLLRMIEQVASDPEVAAQAAYQRVALDDVRGGSEEQRERLLEGYRDVAKAYPETSAGERAAGRLFKVERLQIGMVAPDIEGVDVDGNPMKLSDFRGKVTVIDFWGFW